MTIIIFDDTNYFYFFFFLISVYFLASLREEMLEEKLELRILCLMAAGYFTTLKLNYGYQLKRMCKDNIWAP